MGSRTKEDRATGNSRYLRTCSKTSSPQETSSFTEGAAQSTWGEYLANTHQVSESFPIILFFQLRLPFRSAKRRESETHPDQGGDQGKKVQNETGSEHRTCSMLRRRECRGENIRRPLDRRASGAAELLLFRRRRQLATFHLCVDVQHRRA